MGLVLKWSKTTISPPVEKNEKLEVLTDVLSRVAKEDRLQLTKMEHVQNIGPANSSGHRH